MLPRRFFASVRMEPTPNPRTFLFKPDFPSPSFPSPVSFEKSVIPGPSPVVSEILAVPGVERLLLFSPHSASVSVSSEIFADASFREKICQLLAASSPDDFSPDAAYAAGSGVESAIREVLDFRVRPAVQADGGDVELVSYAPGEKRVLLRMKGACEGCPSSEQTLRNSITETLRFFLPNDVEVVECTEEADGPIRHSHVGEPLLPEEKAAIVAAYPFVSLFATKPVDAKMKERVGFASRLEIVRKRITADLAVTIKCGQCGAAKGLEAIDSLLLTQPQQTETAAVMVCPVCVVLCSVKD